MPENNIHAGEDEELTGETKSPEATETTEAETGSAERGFGRCGDKHREKSHECGRGHCGEHRGRHGNGRCCESPPGSSNY